MRSDVRETVLQIWRIGDRFKPVHPLTYNGNRNIPKVITGIKGSTRDELGRNGLTQNVGKGYKLFRSFLMDVNLSATLKSFSRFASYPGRQTLKDESIGMVAFLFIHLLHIFIILLPTHIFFLYRLIYEKEKKKYLLKYRSRYVEDIFSK